MATYKKRGNKIRTKKVDDLDKIEFDGESTTQEVFDALDETASRSEKWLEKNQKYLYTVLGVILIGTLAYLAFNKFIQEPKEVKAANELAYSKSFFDEAENANISIDSLYTLALEGVDGKYGLLDIADKYSSTKAGNLAKYMAGISYLKMSDYKNAIDMLGKFSSEDQMLAPIAKGAMGDAFADIDQPNDAFDYYKKAANLRDNEFTTPLYLFKAANTALEIGKFDEAEKMFTRIKNEYSKSEEAKEIDLYINRAKHASRN